MLLSLLCDVWLQLLRCSGRSQQQKKRAEGHKNKTEFKISRRSLMKQTTTTTTTKLWIADEFLESIKDIRIATSSSFLSLSAQRVVSSSKWLSKRETTTRKGRDTCSLRDDGATERESQRHLTNDILRERGEEKKGGRRDSRSSSKDRKKI